MAHINGQPHHPGSQHGVALRWCNCGKCRPIPESKARVCCRDDKGLCILQTDPELTFLVLQTRAVQTAVNAQHCNLHVGSWEYSNRNMRYTAYRYVDYIKQHFYLFIKQCPTFCRQYIFATIGPTGKGNRVPVPSCVTWAIRDKWPSHEAYKGFHETPVTGQHLSQPAATVASTLDSDDIQDSDSD